MMIVFWSLFHGQAATTANLTAISAYMALTSEKRSLVVHNQLTHNMLEHYLNLEAEGSDPNKGIDPVLRELKNRNLKADEISRYTTALLDDSKLDVLMGSSFDHQAKEENIHQIFASFCHHAKAHYHRVFVDAHAGVTDSALDLMASSDLIVININQNRFLLDKTQSFLKANDMDPGKCLFLLGAYHKDNRLSLRNIRGRYGFKNLLAMPYNTCFCQSLNNQRTVDFIHKNLEVKTYDPNHDFMTHLSGVAAWISLKDKERRKTFDT